MISILSRSFRTANRLDTWDAPDHWQRQQDDYRTRRAKQETLRARHRRDLDQTGIQ